MGVRIEGNIDNCQGCHFLRQVDSNTNNIDGTGFEQADEAKDPYSTYLPKGPYCAYLRQSIKGTKDCPLGGPVTTIPQTAEDLERFYRSVLQRLSNPAVNS